MSTRVLGSLSSERYCTSNKFRVILQVVPVTLYGPCGQLNANALLDSGSTCSLIPGDVADQLGWSPYFLGFVWYSRHFSS